METQYGCWLLHLAIETDSVHWNSMLRRTNKMSGKCVHLCVCVCVSTLHVRHKPGRDVNYVARFTSNFMSGRRRPTLRVCKRETRYFPHQFRHMLPSKSII